jgi:hypothetical protein
VPAQQTQAAGTTYYVSKSGSDSNSGTQSSPWLTIQKAANTLQAGDTVQVRAGTYYERIRPARSGSSGAYITSRAYPGETAVIDGSGVSIDYYGLFGINDKQYIAVDGFEIRNAGSSGRVYPGVGVTGSGSAYITLKNLTIHNCANSGIMVDGANDFPSTSFIHNITIENCVIYHNNVYWGQESISLIAVDGFEIKNCKVYDAQGTQGGRDEIVEGIDCKEGTKNGSIHDCEVYDTLIGIYLDSGQTPQSNIKIYNNKIHDNIDDGIRLAAEGQASLTNISIYNNLIYNNQSRGFIVENYNFTVSFNFINNTLYNNNSAEIAVFNPDSKTTGVFRNNVVYATSEYAYILRYPSGGTHTTIDHNLFYDPHGYTGQSNTLGSNYVTANPSFVSTSGLDFRLQSTSPAINIGSSSGAPSTDYAGNTRPNGTAYDVGAYEYTGASSSGTLTLDTIGNKSITATQTLSFTISATNTAGGTLTYSASSLPSGATFTASTRTFTWTPTSSQAGTYSNIHFQVTNGTLTDSENITITVSAASTNHAPVLASIGGKSVSEGSALSFVVSATDADNDTLTYSASNLPSGASFSASTRTFSWTPGYSQSGAYSAVHFQVSDGKATDTEDITITVNNTNRAPVLAAIGNKSVNAGQALSFTISATDADSNTLTYSASNLPSGATFTASTRTFTWTPTSSQVGTFSGVRFQVSDGTATDYENITITVNAASTPTPTPTPTPPPSGGGGGGGSPPSTDNAPVLAAIGSKSVNEGSVLSFTISATDADGDTLTYSASNLPSGANFNTSTRTFSWTPSYTQAGTYTSVHFQVSDGEKIDYENVSIIVADISTAPVIASIGNKLVTVGQTVKFTISATDAEGGTLTYTATNLPPGAKFDPATRTFTWTPTYEQVGTYYNVTFKVSDGANTSTDTITIKVYKRRWYR